MASKRKSFVVLNRVSEAFELYNALTERPFAEVRGERVIFDLGSYAHICEDEELLIRIKHITETLVNPDEIRRSHHRERPFREVYVNTFYTEEKDTVGEPFLVVLDRRPVLRFWTCILPTPGYLRAVRRGKLIWKPKN